MHDFRVVHVKLAGPRREHAPLIVDLCEAIKQWAARPANKYELKGEEHIYSTNRDGCWNARFHLRYLADNANANDLRQGVAGVINRKFNIAVRQNVSIMIEGSEGDTFQQKYINLGLQSKPASRST